MMEDLSPSVAVTLSLGNPVCENLEISNKIEIKRIKLVSGTPSLMSDPALVQDESTISRWGTSNDCVKPETDEVAFSMPMGNGAKSVAPIMIHMTENGSLVHEVQETEEDKILSLRKDPGIMSGVESPSETLSPIAVKIESTKNGQIVAKIIALEERNLRQKTSDDRIIDKPNEEHSFDEPKVEASVVSLMLSSKEDPRKGGVKSVFELECVPLWGSVSICGHAEEMEDAIIAAPHFMKIPIKMFIGEQVIDGISQTLSHLSSHFFGVYDGHGGSQVANYCRDRIHLALEEEINNINNDLINGSGRDTRQVYWEKVFINCFVNVDHEVGGTASRGVVGNGHTDSPNRIFEPAAPETVGSTAVVAVVCSSHIIVANCGDSRAVLCRGKEAVALSIDHKPNREDEYARIEASGGKVFQWDGHRVFGVLAMSRSIGDRYLKPSIIPDPEVMFVPRVREDECLIIASDGLWDVMKNEEVCEVTRKRLLIWHKKNGTQPLPNLGVDPAAQSAAEYLANLALQRGSRDNISVIVVDLKSQRKFKSKS